MRRSPVNVKRRDFLKIGSLAAAAIAGSSAAVLAQGAQPRVDEKDPQAQGLGYKADAAQVDKKKFAQYKSGQTCSSCQFFQGKPGDAWAPCQIFANKLVSGKGWCSAYSKKA